MNYVLVHVWDISYMHLLPLLYDILRAHDYHINIVTVIL